jgi:ribosomal protein S18 acetylase RimI-like enzyme
MVQHVGEAPDLPAAFEAVRKQPNGSILIAIGFERSEVYAHLNAGEANQLEIIIVLPRPSQWIERIPSSSLLQVSPFVTTQNPIPALRKAIVSLRTRRYASIRPLDSEEDFRAYFSLRYSVWKQLSYMPPEKNCADSQWELDYTDRTSLPIGAFSKEGDLIGCSRLVRGVGEDVPKYVSLIHRLVEEKNDPKLLANFRYPVGLMHPFDVLESFPQFREYYRSLVKNGTPKAEVSRVIVKPECRHQGLGEVLVDSLISLARTKQIEVLFLACRKEHRDFYGRCGFRVIAGMECEHFVNVNVPAMAMERDLRKV